MAAPIHSAWTQPLTLSAVFHTPGAVPCIMLYTDNFIHLFHPPGTCRHLHLPYSTLCNYYLLIGCFIN